MRITWLGQGGFLFQLEGKRLAVDPYLSNSLDDKGFPRMFPSPVAPSGLKADYLICTHDHGDHFDPDTVVPAVRAYPETMVLGPASVVEHAGDLGLTVELFEPDQSRHSIEPFSVEAVPAHHSDSKAVGVLIFTEDFTVYLTGDSTYEPTLAENALRRGSIDLLLICINGKLGNMTYLEALKVAQEIRPRMIVPMHYGMFENNTIDPGIFLEEASRRRLEATALTVNVETKLTDLLGGKAMA